MIVLMAGLPGTGKSTIARELAFRTQGVVLSKDEIRAAIFTSQHTDYSPEQDDFVMEIMLDSARFLCRQSPEGVIVLDGRTFSKTYQIDRVLAAADDIKQPWKILECICSQSSAQHRLEKTDPHHPAHNRSFELYLQVKDRFQPITRPKTVIDTDLAFEECVQRALVALTTT